MNTLDQFRTKYKFDLNGATLGRGGFGKVYKGIDSTTGKPVAIKKSEVVDGNFDKYSLKEEGELAKTFDHSNIIRFREVYRFKTDVGLFDFAVMEFADKGSLDDFMRSMPDLDQINKTLKGILEGIQYLHDRGVIHRDLKPSNILIKSENGQLIPKIIDFGISKSTRNKETHLSAIIGSTEYMSPEQLGGGSGKISKASDLWSIGVIIYQMFAGELPFGSRKGNDTSEMITNRIFTAPIPEEIYEIDEPYANMIRACLIKDSNKRIDSAQELLDILEGRTVFQLAPSNPPPIPTSFSQPPPVTIPKVKKAAPPLKVGTPPAMQKSNPAAKRVSLLPNQRTAQALRSGVGILVFLTLVWSGLDIIIFSGDWGGILYPVFSELGLYETNMIYDLFIASILLFFGILLIVFILFLSWMGRAYRNLHRLKGPKLNYGKGMAAGSWFLPLVNLIIPFQIVKETWHKTQKANPMRQTYRKGTTIGWWWAIGVIGIFYSFFHYSYFLEDRGSDIHLVSYLFSTILTIILFILTRKIVRNTSKFEKELRQAVELKGAAASN